MPDFIGARVTAERAITDLKIIDAQVDAATLAALKKTQAMARNSVRSGMRGRPRWDRRGAVGRDKSIPAVNLKLTPHHVSKGGGPGELTGHLRRAVGVVKRPKKVPGGFSGGVGTGGPKSVTNLYRSHVEANYPYMKPGVDRAKPKMPAVWEAAWGKAMNTTRR